MSAVPKKKLCWNCEGNIAKEIDNCPYCGVYVHSPDLDENSGWSIPYVNNSKKEEIPSPLYQIHGENEDLESEDPLDKVEESSPAPSMLQQFKEDILPILLLMSGSIFFLFGIVLFLFSDHHGTLTLQWNASQWPCFLLLSLPCVCFGWKYLLQLDQDEKESGSGK